MSGKCASCGQNARQRRRAFVSDGPGLLRAALVCSACFGGAVSVVMQNEQIAKCDACGVYGRRVVCEECNGTVRAKTARELLEPAVRIFKALRTQIEKSKRDAPSRDVLQFLEGKIEALDGVIATLETEGKASEGRAVLTMLTTDSGRHTSGAPTNDGGETDAS